MTATLIGLLLPLIQIFPKLITQGINIQREWTLLFILIPIGTAVSEEYLFRGFFLRHLLAYFPPIIANSIVSLLFAAIHLPLIILINNNGLTVTLSRLYLLTFSSFFFGFLFLKFKSLIPPVLAHFLNNLILAL